DVRCDRKKGPGPGCEPNAGQHEDRKRKPEELKPFEWNEIAQCGIATLKDAEHPEIDEPEKLRAGRILKGTRSQFGAKRGGKEHKWSQELELKKSTHEINHTSKTLACLNGSPAHGARSSRDQIDKDQSITASYSA